MFKFDFGQENSEENNCKDLDTTNNFYQSHYMHTECRHRVVISNKAFKLIPMVCTTVEDQDLSLITLKYIQSSLVLGSTFLNNFVASIVDNSSSCVKCVAVLPSKDSIVKQILDNSKTGHVLCKEFNLMHISTDDVLELLRSLDKPLKADMSVLLADENNSDLQTDVYEGGSKIWECTFDLMHYIKDNNIHFKGKKVLDLGCGVGLLGLLSLSRDASMCIFQDYNIEVLKYFTIPNVMLNDEAFSRNYSTRSSFYSGDWSYFVNTVKENHQFDYILTSETIYNRNSYEKLHNTFQHLLKKDGVIYLAAKSYYFGVGGGIALFTEFLRKKNIFNVENCWECSSGVKREVLKITFI